jgi:hypothetical protein
MKHHCTPEHLHDVLTKPSRFASKTVKESARTAEQVKAQVKASYESTTNQGRVLEAHTQIEAKGELKLYTQTLQNLEPGKAFDDQDIVNAQVLAQRFQKEGDFDTAIA